MQSNFFQQYKNELRPKLQKDLGLKNVMQIPKIEKIIINAGIGSYLQRLNSKDTSLIEENLKLISGQKPLVKKAKLSVSNFKLRKGMPVGVFVTLRKQNAYNFLEKLIHVSIPRMRDFRGIKKNIFDKQGNCSIGINDYTVFPEVIPPENAQKIHGLQITIVFSSNEPSHSQKLLEYFGFPFKK